VVARRQAVGAHAARPIAIYLSSLSWSPDHAGVLGYLEPANRRVLGVAVLHREARRGNARRRRGGSFSPVTRGPQREIVVEEISVLGDDLLPLLVLALGAAMVFAT